MKSIGTLALGLIALSSFGQTNTFPSNGNVGIETINPIAKIEVKGGNILVRNLRNTNDSSAIMIGHSINFSNYDTFGTSLRTIVQSQGANRYGLQFYTQDSYATGQTEKMRIGGNGNVGIGTTAPDELLTVKGKIHAQEVKVDLNGAMAPDYVFREGYELRPLAEVRAYIKKEGHLPDIPSAKDMDLNGINLKEMNLKLLEKIEELTLYAIQQKQETNTLIEMLEKVKCNYKH